MFKVAKCLCESTIADSICTNLHMRGIIFRLLLQQNFCRHLMLNNYYNYLNKK